MDKVLFLLCIPEDDNENEKNTQNSKKDETNSTQKPKLRESGEKAQTTSPTAESAVDPKTKGTADEQTKTLPASGGTQAEGGKSPQDEKQKDNSHFQTTENVLPIQLTVSSKSGNVSTETEEKQANIVEKPGFAATEKQVSVSSDAKKGSEQKDLAATVSDGGERQSSDVEDENIEGSPLLSKKKLGKDLVDDFWDFGTSATEETSALTHQAESDQDQNRTEQPKENVETESQIAENAQNGVLDDNTKLRGEKDKTDLSEEFVTCPNTPVSSIKGQDSLSLVSSNVDLITTDTKVKIISDKFTTVPVLMNPSLKKSIPSSDSAGSKKITEPSSEKPGTLAKEQLSDINKGDQSTNTDKKILVSDKFVTIPVQEDITPEVPIHKSASTGQVKMSDASKESAVVDRTVLTVGCKEKKSCSPTHSPEMKRKMTPVKLPDPHSTDIDELVDFLPQLSLKKQVKNCLSDLGIKNVAWQKCTGDRVWQVTFVETSGVRCEDILLKLQSIGVGCVQNSSVSILPVTIHAEKVVNEQVTETQEEVENDENEEKVEQMEAKTNEFQKSIKSRLVVQQVVKSVESNAGFTFDYVMLIILASVIAALGLVENSSVVLVASMLISPLMGPILAGTFGTVIKNKNLRNLGICSELLGLGICLICGFLCGLIAAGLEAGGSHWRSAGEWPTLEMSSRGMLRGLLIGMFIALPSGAGVALSVLGGNTGSLVGVAISASLLPPAVNGGMLWSSALIAALSPPVLVMQTELRNISEVINGTVVSRMETISTPVLMAVANGLQCPQIRDNEYVHTYFCDLASDYAALGSISLLLTILNIFCIFVMGVLFLKIKEVAPRTSTQLDQNFFQKDIKVARESYTTTKGPQSAILGKKWLEEYKALKKQMELDVISEEESDTIEFQQILQSVENSPDVIEFLGRVPNGRLRPMSQDMAPDFHQAVAKHVEKHPELERVYHTLGHSASGTRSPVLRQLPYNVYHTIRSPWNIYHHNPETPVFVFPTSYPFRREEIPASPRFPVQSHLRLAPIYESNDEKADDTRPHKRTPRLYIPNKSSLQEKTKRERASSEHLSDSSVVETGARHVQVQQQEQPEGMKSRKGYRMKHDTPKQKAQKTREFDDEISTGQPVEQIPLLKTGASNVGVDETEKPTVV